jgi:hypothetical protein
MGFEPGDLVQLSKAGHKLGQERGLTPKNQFGRVTSIEDEAHPGGPWNAVYMVDFDGYSVYMSEPLLEKVGPLEHLALEGL